MKFPQSQTAVALANPLFILQRLRRDTDVQSFAAATAPQEIYKRLVESLKRKPLTLEARTLPYVYLIALASKQDIDLLRRAARLPSTKSKWFHYLSNVLVQEAVPTTRMDLRNTIVESPALYREYPNRGRHGVNRHWWRLIDASQVYDPGKFRFCRSDKQSAQHL